MEKSADEVYQQHVRSLPVAERLRLVEMTARDLVVSSESSSQRPTRSILELHGLGKEIWKDLDAQVYVSELRREWDHRPWQ